MPSSFTTTPQGIAFAGTPLSMTTPASLRIGSQTYSASPVTTTSSTINTRPSGTYRGSGTALTPLVLEDDDDLNGLTRDPIADWSREDDEALRTAKARGLCIPEIVKRFLPHQKVDAVYKRWELLVTRDRRAAAERAEAIARLARLAEHPRPPAAPQELLKNLSPRESHLGQLIRLHVHTQRYLGMEPVMPNAELICRHITTIKKDRAAAQGLYEDYMTEIASMNVSLSELDQLRRDFNIALDQWSPLYTPNVVQSAADLASERKLRRMLKDDFSGLIDTAAEGENPIWDWQIPHSPDTATSCELQGLTCGKDETTWAEPFCSGFLAGLSDEKLNTMLIGDKAKVKGIPDFAIDAVQSVYVGKQLELSLGRPIEPRSAATLAMLCGQTDYQAQASNADILLTMGHWTMSARIEQSLAPLYNSGGGTRRDWESALHAAFPRENWPEDAAFGSFTHLFEHEQNWVELSPIKVTAERLNKRGVD
ncbi:hypothetical protein CBER1_01140 [Cercospora berteroae]|uniref:Uncharacterized protein n=1 Tax=Cercospora berteroae TaxID=357750 RepID=A0A2S6C3A1_9PEZI|nr:hypothetical protein CBER1_01140 [Cercospora berteroae]